MPIADRKVSFKNNPLGFKGAGEARAISACPAAMNAVVDALWRADRTAYIDMPAMPAWVWAAIEDGKRRLRLWSRRALRLTAS